jgi:hypothetical protein
VVPTDFKGAVAVEMIAERAAKESLLYGAGSLESMDTYSTNQKTGHLSSIGI